MSADLSHLSLEQRRANLYDRTPACETDAYEQYMEGRCSDGTPMLEHPKWAHLQPARWTPGLRWCEYCGADTLGEDLCPRCLEMADPFANEPREKPPMRGFDGASEPTG